MDKPNNLNPVEWAGYLYNECKEDTAWSDYDISIDIFRELIEEAQKDYKAALETYVYLIITQTKEDHCTDDYNRNQTNLTNSQWALIKAAEAKAAGRQNEKNG